MQSPTTVEAPPVKRKYVKKDPSKEKKKKKPKWETDSPALKTDPVRETPEPIVVEKNYAMKEGQWVEEQEKDLAIQSLLAEVDMIPQIGSPPGPQSESPPRAPLAVVDLLTCPFHLKPLTRKKPPDEIEKQEVLFCPELDCPVFLFASNIEAYLQALHYTPPSQDVIECWDILQCFCHFTPILKLSQSEANPNRLYLSCNNWCKELKCPYFQWFDEPFSNKNAAWQDEMRFEFKQLPVPASRQEAKRKAQEHKEACKKMAFQQYFTNLKADQEEKRKNLVKTGGGGGGGGPREDGGGGGGPRKSPFVYYKERCHPTRSLPLSMESMFDETLPWGSLPYFIRERIYWLAMVHARNEMGWKALHEQLFPFDYGKNLCWDCGKELCFMNRTIDLSTDCNFSGPMIFCHQCHLTARRKLYRVAYSHQGMFPRKDLPRYKIFVFGYQVESIYRPRKYTFITDRLLTGYHIGGKVLTRYYDEDNDYTRRSHIFRIFSIRKKCI